MILNEQYFQEKFRRMGVAFNVPDARLKRMADIYYAELCNCISDRQFDRSCTHILHSFDRFPSIQSILEVARLNPEPKPKHEKTSCDLCNGAGVLHANSHCNGMKYGTIFKCPSCDNCTTDYPVWSDNWEKNGYTLTRNQ